MKVNQKPRTMMFSAPAVVASAYDKDGKADCCTLAFATMCSHRPPAVMIAINTTLKRKTLKSILHSKEFAVAFPSVEHVAETDYIGTASGYDTDKLADVGFTFKNAEMVNANHKRVQGITRMQGHAYCRSRLTHPDNWRNRQCSSRRGCLE